jgi:pentose-5-phosphate-3-epimerase
MALDERTRDALRELGNALNEAVSSSARVHEILQRIREEGSEPYLVLDATVALEGREHRTRAALPSIRRGGRARREETAETRESEGTSFKIDVKDLHFLRSVGIDPTRAARAPRGRRRPGTTVTLRSTVAERT